MPRVAPAVFLSYARKDGEEFATALRKRLADEAPEIALWQDRSEMEGGVGWWRQIEDALDHVKFLVIVMTPHALVSEMTRKEWRCARQRGVLVYPVKAAPDAELDYASLPRWMSKAHFFDIGQFTGGKWHDTKEWQTFVNYLKSDREPVRVPFMAPDPPAGFVPRDREFDELLPLVIGPAHGEPVAITTALQGAGGYGKTTLAIAVCHDERVVEAFDDGVLWASLGQTPHLVDELAKLYEALAGQRPVFLDVPHAAAKLAEKLEYRHCLIVIDDVWERAHLEPFLKGGPQCTRLVTTRRLDLVASLPRVRVDQMTAAESTRLLGMALEPQSVGETGLAMLAERLGEWPLLLKLAAGMIRKRIARGDSSAGALDHVTRALDKRGVTAFDQADAAQRDAAVRRTVAASLDQLSADDRRRLHELAIFPEKTAIPLTTLERLWELDDLETAECAGRLDDVALVMLDLRRGVIALHDVMHSYLQQELHDSRSVHARLVTAYGEVGSLPDEYAWRWFPYHLVQAGQAEELRALLLRPSWLDAKLRAIPAEALVRDFDLVSGDADLDAVQSALRLALPALGDGGDQLWEQLLGRLPRGHSPRLDAFQSDLVRAAPPRRLRARWPNLESAGGDLIQTITGHTAWVAGVVLLADGRALSWGGDSTLRLWDLNSGEDRVLDGHTDPVTGVVLLPRGRAVSWSEDRTLRVWDLATGESTTLTGHRMAVTGACSVPRELLLSWGTDGPLRLWDLATGEVRVLSGHTGPVRGARLLADGRVLSWSDDGTLRNWDLATGQARVFSPDDGWVSGALVVSEEVVSWGAGRTLRLWDLATGEARALERHEDRVRGALELPDRHVLSWSDDSTLRVWDLAGLVSRTLRGHRGAVTGAALLDDGSVLSWGSDRTLRLWDLTNARGRIHGRILTQRDEKVSGALSLGAGRALTWSLDELCHWDLAKGESHTLTGHERPVRGALPLPNGRALSWGDDASLRVWNVATRARRAFVGHEDFVIGAHWLAGGRALTWSRDTTLRVWDLATGHARVLSGHKDEVNGAFSLLEERVVSWSQDGTLRAWDLASGDGRVLGTAWRLGQRRAAGAGRSGPLVGPRTRAAPLRSDHGPQPGSCRARGSRSRRAAAAARSRALLEPRPVRCESGISRRWMRESSRGTGAPCPAPAS